MRAVLISPDRDMAAELEAALGGLGGVALVRKLDRYPDDVDLVRLLRAFAPQVIFLSVESLGDAITVAKHIEARAPGLPAVAFGRRCDPPVLLEVMRAGVREFLQLPVPAAALQQAIFRIAGIVERTPPPVASTDLVFAFLPSKAGVGTSTVALNAGVAMAEFPGARVLLADFDLNNGMIGFMLKLENPYSLVNAAENALRLDENLWPQLVSTVGQLDLLPSGKMNPGFEMEAAHVRRILDFARRHYKVICVDLSGNMEKHCVEVMHEAKQIFLVCTQELPSLHLARRKLSHLRSLDLEDRVRIVLNRTQKRSVIGAEEVERLLGMPVYLSFPNDYAGVHQSLTKGKRVDPSSQLGMCFRRMAETILSSKPYGAGEKRRFVEYFSILPARYSLFPTEKKT